MRKQKLWRVRVVRKVEEWADVESETPLQAETLAAMLPGVLNVFAGSALRGDRPIGSVPALGVIDDEDE